MVSLSPCEILNSKIDSLMLDFNNKIGIVNSSVMDLNNTLETMTSQTGIGDLEGQLNSKKGQSLSELGNLSTLSTNFAGSCLDSITNELFGILNDSSTLSSDVFNTIDGLTNIDGLLSKLGGVKNILGELGLSKMLEKIDETLGCLADNNDCIPTDKIQTVLNTIDGLLQSNGLNQSGEFNIESLLDEIPDMDSLLKDNIKMISDTVDSFEEEAKNMVLASTQKAKTYYDELKW